MTASVRFFHFYFFFFFSVFVVQVSVRMGVNENLLIFIYFYLFFFVREIAKQRRIHVDHVHASAPKHQQGPKARNGFLQTRSHACGLSGTHDPPSKNPGSPGPWPVQAPCCIQRAVLFAQQQKQYIFLSRTQPTRYIDIHSIMSPKPNPFFIIIIYLFLK